MGVAGSGLREQLEELGMGTFGEAFDQVQRASAILYSKEDWYEQQPEFPRGMTNKDGNRSPS